MLRDRPVALSEMLLAVDFLLDVPKEIVIVTARSRAEAEPLLAEIREAFVPNRVLAVATEAAAEAAASVVPLLDSKIAIGGKPTAYVCEKQICALPTSDPGVLARQIRKVERLSRPPG